jgi:hypothetical protein
MAGRRPSINSSACFNDNFRLYHVRPMVRADAPEWRKLANIQRGFMSSSHHKWAHPLRSVTFWGFRVQRRVNRTELVAVLALVGALGGCANVDFDTSQNWFAKPLDVTGRNAGGYTFSELADARQRQRPITANDLVDANGGCAAPAASQPTTNSGGSPATNPAPADTASLLGGGIALGMSECDVVFRAGQPARADIGKNPNGDRTAVLTITGGPRPGVYHFERGSLTVMDRTQQAAAPPQPEKKKAEKTSKPKKSNQT